MSLHNLIANGGKVLVFGGLSKHFGEFRSHPQLVFWSGEPDSAEIRQAIRNHNGKLPPNVNGLIISRFMKHAYTGKIMADARDKRVPIMPHKNNHEIKELLRQIIQPTTVKEITVSPEQPQQSVSVEQPRPKTITLIDFVAKHDNVNIAAATEGRRIFQLAKNAGFQTTEGSVVQGIRTVRRRLGIISPRAKARTQRAKPTYSPTVKPSHSLDGFMTLLQDTMAGLALIKEEAKNLQRERAEFAKLRDIVSRINA